MFTGIIEATGEILESGAGGLRFRPGPELPELRRGDSVSVNGVCLTARTAGTDSVVADVSAETLSKTNLGLLRRGNRVNLESALTLNKPLGGHLLQGHVDTCVHIHHLQKEAHSWTLAIQIPGEFRPLVVERGSIGVDGVSLTIATISDDLVHLVLIPHTLSRTILTGYTSGQMVNLEFDIAGKYIIRYLQTRDRNASPLTLDRLREMGY